MAEKNCSTCEFNFGEICAGHDIRIDNGKDIYGSKIEDMQKMFPNGCKDWGISFDAFCKEENKTKKGTL